MEFEGYILVLMDFMHTYKNNESNDRFYLRLCLFKYIACLLIKTLNFACFLKETCGYFPLVLEELCINML